MDRDLAALTASTADPAFATDSSGAILAWNAAATELLGYDGRTVNGKRCYDLLAGKDIHGNPFCSAACRVLRSVQLKTPLHRFLATLRSANGEDICVRVCVLSVPHGPSAEKAILHLLEACSGCGAPLVLGDLSPATSPAAQGAGRGSPLSHRELEVLGLMAQGWGTREISKVLAISVTTVRNHVQHILDKLEAHSRLDAVCAAHRQGIL